MIVCFKMHVSVNSNAPISLYATQAKREIGKKFDRLKAQQRSAPDYEHSTASSVLPNGRLSAWNTSTSTHHHDNSIAAAAVHDSSTEGRLVLNRLDHRPRDWNLLGSTSSALSSADNSAAPSRTSSPGDNSGANGGVWWGVHPSTGRSNGTTSEPGNAHGENSSAVSGRSWARNRPSMHHSSPGSEAESGGGATVETATSEDGVPNSVFAHVRPPLGASPGSDSGRSRGGEESLSDGNNSSGGRGIRRRRNSKGSSPSIVLSANVGWAESLQRLLQRRPSSKSLGLRPSSSSSSSSGSNGHLPLAPLNKTSPTNHNGSPADATNDLSPSSIASPTPPSSSSSSPSPAVAGSLLPAPITAASSTTTDHSAADGGPHNNNINTSGSGQRSGGSGLRAAGAVRSFNREEWEFAWGNDTVLSPSPKSKKQASEGHENLSPRIKHENNDDFNQSQQANLVHVTVNSPRHSRTSKQEANPSSDVAPPRSPLSPTSTNRRNSQLLSPTGSE